MEEYLVVYEDEWNNKESFKTNKIGNMIKWVKDSYEIECECDIDKLNSDQPMTALTFGYGFYDVPCYSIDDEEEYKGRIMIFYIGDDE